MAKTVETTEAAFRLRLDSDKLVNFSTQKEITDQAAELWAGREKVTGEAVWVPAPASGIFADGKDVWAVREERPVESGYPYIFSPNVDSFPKLLAVAAMGLELQRKGKKPALVTNFVMEQRSEREVSDLSGEIHGVSGIEMALLEPVAALLAQAFPRGLIHTDGHSLGFEYWANIYGLPVLTLTSMPKLINAAFNHNMVRNQQSASVSGDVGGVMLMNMVTEYVCGFGLEIESIYGEKRATQVFNDWARSRLRGKQVFFGDDITSTGRTIFTEVLPGVFDAEATNALVFVPHADLVPKTLENLTSVQGDVKMIVGNTFPVRPEMTKVIAANNRLLMVPVFESVMQAAAMDAANLLTRVHTDEAMQRELLRQTELAIFQPYVSRFRTASDMLE